MKKLLLSVTLAFAVFTASAAVTNAATYTVNRTYDSIGCNQYYCSLRGALMLANMNAGNHTIVFSGSGTYALTRTMRGFSDHDNYDLDVTNTTGTVRIIGNGVNDTIIDGNALDRVLQLYPGTTVEIYDLTITGGSTVTGIEGGGIFTEGNLLLDNVQFTNNIATSSTTYTTTGGALAANGANVYITGGSFDTNEAIHKGGAIYAENSTLAIQSSTFSNNVADYFAGGIYASESTVTIDDSEFTTNIAVSSGAAKFENSDVAISNSEFDSNESTTSYVGGVLLSDTCATIDSSTFTGNTSSSTAGALYAEATTYDTACSVDIIDSVFEQNTAAAGGAVYITTNVISEISGSTFTENSVTGSGGALHASGEVEVNNSTFENNYAGIAGGAIDTYLANLYSDLVIESTIFNENDARLGGAVYIDVIQVVINGAQFVNSSGTTGAAIHITGTGSVAYLVNSQMNGTASTSSPESTIYNDGTLYMENSGVLNTTNSRAAIYNMSGSDLAITRSQINGNTGTQYGAVYVYNANTAYIEDSIIQGNTGSQYSGAISHTAGPLDIIRTRVVNNSGVNGAGIRVAGTADLNIQDSTFAGNTATNHAGAVYFTGSNMIINGSTFEGNVSGYYGGALYTTSNNTATMEVVNSTFTGNESARDGSAIAVISGTLDILFSTITDNIGNTGLNSRRSGSAVYVDYRTLRGNVGYTLLDNNTNAYTGSTVNCSGSGAMTSLGYNLFSDNACSPISAVSTDITNTSSGYGVLQHSGGSTQTIPLTSGSAAIDAVPTATCQAVVTNDQRGVARANGTTTGSACDIGAYEYES